LKDKNFQRDLPQVVKKAIKKKKQEANNSGMQNNYATAKN